MLIKLAVSPSSYAATDDDELCTYIYYYCVLSRVSATLLFRVVFRILNAYILGNIGNKLPAYLS